VESDKSTSLKYFSFIRKNYTGHMRNFWVVSRYTATVWNDNLMRKDYNAEKLSVWRLYWLYVFLAYIKYGTDKLRYPPLFIL
jgi:hypothetical protein